jgi:hypothetical protein
VIGLAAGAALALVAAAALVSLGRPRSIVGALLATMVVAEALIVALAFALSAASEYMRWWLLGALALVAVAGVAFGLRRGSLPRPARAPLREACADPAVLVLAAVVVCELAYVLALALFTPQNDGDAIHYHLTRAALWRQDAALGTIDGTADVRMNAFPPNAEILTSATMVLSASARYVGLVQLVAALVTALAVAGIARRIGLGRRPAAFGALLFLALPIVALQASTALNDVVVASLVAAGAYFVLGRTRHDAVAAATAVALLVGTKVTGLIALPGLALLAVVAHRGPARLRALAAIAAGALVGAYWYAVNLWRTDDVFGGFPDDQRGGLDPVDWLGRFDRLLLDALELPGAAGRDRLLYVAAAAVVLCVGLLVVRTRRGRLGVVLAAVLTLLPLLVLPVRDGLVRVHQKAWFELGRSDLGDLDPGRSGTKAGTLFTWYGPIGALVVLAAGVLVIRRVRRGALPAGAVVLALAPFLWVAGVAVAVTYFEWNGRFAMGGFALAAATWGVLLDVRPAAWAAVAVSAVTVGLTVVHYDEKPSGVRLLEPTSAHSVWTAPRWRVQGIVPSLGTLIRLTDERIPPGSTIAVWPSPFPEEGQRGIQLLPFPLLGTGLERRLVYARDAATAERKHAGWLILPDDAPTPCADGWREAFRAPPRWIAFERDPGARCSP